MRLALPLLVPLLVAVGDPSAASDWLSPEVESALAERVAARLEEVGVRRGAGTEQRLELSRSVVTEIARRVDALGLEGVLEATPVLEAIAFPPVEEPIVAATASYLVCSLSTDPGRYETDDRRLTVVAAEASVVIVTVFLRHRFLASGGTDREIREYLAHPAMMEVLEAMQTDEELRARVWSDCGPMFAAMLR